MLHSLYNLLQDSSPLRILCNPYRTMRTMRIQLRVVRGMAADELSSIVPSTKALFLYPFSGTHRLIKAATSSECFKVKVLRGSRYPIFYLLQDGCDYLDLYNSSRPCWALMIVSNLKLERSLGVDLNYCSPGGGKFLVLDPLVWGLQKKLGAHFRSPYNKDHSICGGSILGSAVLETTIS